jgi:SPX domain protein involved in polyphosphate accumulation
MMEKPFSVTTYFQRHEQKYLLNAFQYHAFLEILKEFARHDEYGLSTIYSIYYDNSDFEIARKALEKSAYKEKLRLRSYGIPHSGDTVYWELKKKFNSLTYKQRVPAPFAGTDKLFDFAPDNSACNYISDEINWFLRYYSPFPRFMISYDRLAFRVPENEALRITFDTNIRWRADGLDFSKGSYGAPLLNEDKYLMELKIDKSIPLFLTDQLTRLKIFPISFSKYRTAYENLLNNREPRYA